MEMDSAVKMKDWECSCNSRSEYRLSMWTAALTMFPLEPSVRARTGGGGKEFSRAPCL